MTLTGEEQQALETLESRMKTVLPEEYHDIEVEPVSMGSATLKYAIDGQVAWNEIWNSFCDLAMAGGPPHKGALLEPGTETEISAQPERHKRCVDEICRGIRSVTGLAVEASPVPGWVRVDCGSSAMAGWLVRAVVMENISARLEDTAIDLPAGPAYRIHKEIKNVITSIAKTSHYWLGHMSSAQQREIGDLFATMAATAPLIEPDLQADSHKLRCEKMAESILKGTGLRAPDHRYIGWLGVECRDVRPAIWMMRAMVVSNVLARREETTLFVPVNEMSDPGGETVVRGLIRIHHFAAARRIV